MPSWLSDLVLICCLMQEAGSTMLSKNTATTLQAADMLCPSLQPRSAVSSCSNPCMDWHTAPDEPAGPTYNFTNSLGAHR